MKITGDKFEEKTHINALYKGESTEVRITVCTRYDEPRRICFDLKEAREFKELFENALVEAERRATLKTDDEE